MFSCLEQNEHMNSEDEQLFFNRSRETTRYGHVWYCQRCEDECDPQTCSKCKSPATIKLKCQRLLELNTQTTRWDGETWYHIICNTMNHVKAKTCIKCNKILKHSRKSFETVQLEEEMRLNNIFLKACKNFYSNKLNGILLFYGYVNFEIKDVCLYKQIPSEIILLCILFAYKSIMLDDTCTFYMESGTPSIATQLQLNDCKDIISCRIDGYCAESVYVNPCIDLETSIRKLWKVKILEYEKNKPINIRIGIVDTYNECTVRFEISSIKDLDAEKSILNVGDTVSILWYSCDSILLFAVNDTQYETISIGVNNYSIYQLVITMYDSVKLQILNE